MKTEDMIMISVDDHLVEPPGMFEGRMPAEFADAAPRVERTPEGNDVWVFMGQQVPNIGLNAVAGRPKEEYGVDPTAFEEMRPGCDDKELAAAVVRAYNDWHIEEWCGSYPGRFIPMALPILWDPQLCAEEIRRVAKKGCHALTFTENPATLGLPSFHDAHWDPIWQALVDEGTMMNVHLGSSGQLAMTAPDAPIDVMITLQPMNICMAAADLVWSRIFKE